MVAKSAERTNKTWPIERRQKRQQSRKQSCTEHEKLLKCEMIYTGIKLLGVYMQKMQRKLKNISNWKTTKWLKNLYLKPGINYNMWPLLKLELENYWHGLI